MRYLKHALALALLSSGTSVSAQEAVADHWQWSGVGYFWGASIGGTSATGSDVDVGIDTLLDNLNFGAMGTINTQKDKLSFFADVVYLNVGEKDSTNSPVPISVDAQLKGLISTLGAGYQFYDQSGTTLEVLGGARLLKFEPDISVNVAGDKIKLDSSDPNWDAIVGLRGTTDLNEDWYLSYLVDVGAGDSDFTYQAMVGVNYRLKNADIAAGYRYMSWDFGNDVYTGFEDINLSGFYLGVRFDL